MRRFEYRTELVWHEQWAAQKYLGEVMRALRAGVSLSLPQANAWSDQELYEWSLDNFPQLRTPALFDVDLLSPAETADLMTRRLGAKGWELVSAEALMRPLGEQGQVPPHTLLWFKREVEAKHREDLR